MLEGLKSINKSIGLKQSLRAVEDGTAKIVYIAKDADERVISNLKNLCVKNSIEIIYVESMKQLGKACGIEVGAAAVCVLKE